VHQFTFSEPKFEPTPLVVNDTIFVTEPPATVVALDAKTGAVIWEYERPVPVDLPIETGRVNRGLAILDNSLFFGSIDGYLIAINANTGKVKWQTRVASSSEGYSLTGAPLVANHSVVIGVAGGDYGARGFLAAYDAMTGQQQWRFDTIPGPGEAGHETWQSEAWKTGGGGTWVTGSYDPSLDLGGVNWEPAAFNPALGLVFVNATEGQSVFTKSGVGRVIRVEKGFFTGSGGSMLGPVTQVVRALDAATGAKRWEHRATLPEGTGKGGMLATAGGTVFGTSGGSLFALDAATGKELWSVGLGGDTRAPPISFTLEGRQVIAALAGRSIFLFGL
jgi:outer membrane protein assembly factor BamB